MIEDASRGIFDVIVFYQIDRTARNEMDYYASVNKLLKLGVRYEYSAEGIEMYRQLTASLQRALKWL